MKTMKRLLSFVLVLALTLSTVGILPMKEAKAATVFTEVPVTVVTDMTNFDQQIGLSWQIDWNVNASVEDYTESRFFKFTIPQDSVVRIKGMTQGIDSFLTDTIKIYANEAMSSLVATINPDGTFSQADDWYEFKAGTYYVEEKLQMEYWSTTTTHTTKISIGAIAKKDAVIFTQTPNKKKTKTTVKMDIKLGSSGDVSQIRVAEGKIPESHYGTYDIWGYPSDTDRNIDVMSPQFSVTKNGWYTVRVCTATTVPFHEEGHYLFYVKVTGIDTVKPTLKGINAGKTYKKSVTGYVKDNGSDIQKVLDGKKKVKLTKVKSGKYKGYYKFKITKKGKHTLKVYDKAGNVKKVTFKIK